MSTREAKPSVANNIQIEFGEAEVKDNVALLKASNDPYKTFCPIDQKVMKEVAKYDQDYSKEFLKASREKGVETMLADSSIEEVKTSSHFGAQTYGKIEARSFRSKDARNVKTGEVTSGPTLTVKVTSGAATNSMRLKEKALLIEGLK